MPKVICMASAKGGSGKTVLTATFATFLVEIKKKVLIIDTDASTNGLTLLYLKEVMLQYEYAISEKRKPSGAFELEQGDYEIVKLKTGVHLIPATYFFQNTEYVALPKWEMQINKLIESIQSDYDYIFLDAQAGSDGFAHVCMKQEISDEVIIVSEYDPLSAAGVERLKALFRENLTYNRTWVLLNKMLPDFVQSFSDFLEVAKYLSPIPWNAEVVKAYSRRKLALDLEYGNEYTVAVMQTLKGLLADEIIKDLNVWSERKALNLRQPVENQLADAKKQLQNFLLMQDEYMSKRRKTTFRTLIYLSLGVIFLTIVMGTSVYKKIFPMLSEKNAVNIQLISAAVTIIITSIVVYSTVKVIKSPQSTEKYEIFDEEFIVLKERIKVLEGLRKADMETLIKRKEEIQI